MHWKLFVKYFLHGILFTVLNIVFYFAWAFMLLVLVSLGSIIGGIIALGFFFIGMGYINTILGVQLWDIEGETDLWKALIHGLTLYIIFAIVNLIIVYLLGTFLPETATYVAFLIISVFPNGVIGKKVSSWFGHP